MLAVAFGAASPALSVAEFAPSAQRALEPPPTTAAADAPSAANRNSRRATTTTTAAPTPSATDPTGASTAPTTRTPRTRACVGSPPRQTEDPQSPPCIAAIFEGDNGGATTRGANATEIRVAVPLAGYNDATGGPVVRALFDYFNQRYEFYGRRLTPVIIPQRSVDDPSSNRAMAADIAAQNVFGTVTGTLEWGSSAKKALFQELARAQVVTIMRGAGMLASDRVLFDPSHPYLWSVYPSSETLQRNIASLACAALVGHPAQHSADGNLQSVTRKFGIVSRGINDAPPSRTLADDLRACGAEVETVEGTSASDVRLQLQSLKAKGVTTVVCLCERYEVFTVYGAAPGAGFRPEWLLTTEPISNAEWGWQAYYKPADPMPVFGIAERPRVVPRQALNWYQALIQVNPAIFDGTSTDTTRIWIAEGIYEQLLVLAAGIQGAGPALTPDTFAQALMSTKFANAGVGTAPYYQGSVGFGPGDHAFYDDFSLAWWNPAAEPLNPDSVAGKGSWCYLGGGTRYRAGTYPADADSRFFNPAEPCR